jgi:transcriptional regulator with XRE-family HTH domain
MDPLTVLVNGLGMAFRPENPPNRIREIRKSKGVSPEKIAEAIGDSTSEQIYKLERSERPLSHGWMTTLAKVLDVRPAALIDADVEFLRPPKSGSDSPEQLERRLLLLDLWDSLERDEQDSLLLSARAFARARTT